MILDFPEYVLEFPQQALTGHYGNFIISAVTTDPENKYENSPLAAPFRGDTRIRLQRVFSCVHGDSTLLMRKRNAHFESCHLSKAARHRRSLNVRVRVRAPPAALLSLMI